MLIQIYYLKIINRLSFFFFYTSEYEFGLFLIISEYCSSSPKMPFIYFGYLFKMMYFGMFQIV